MIEIRTATFLSFKKYYILQTNYQSNHYYNIISLKIKAESRF